MTVEARWIAAALTLAIVALYEAWFAWAQRRRPAQVGRSAHAALRDAWFDAVSQQAGSEVLAVQTLRNSLMSASMIASTAALGLMGAVTLSAAALGAGLDGGGPLALQPRLAVDLGLLALLLAALVTSVMAVRSFHHAGYVAAMPVGSDARRRWTAVGRDHLRRAGVLYGWAIRNLVLVVPAVASILHPAAGPVAALAVVLVLSGFDRLPA